MFAAVTQSYLLELIESYVNMSDEDFHDNVRYYPSRYPMRDRLWCEIRPAINAIRGILNGRTFPRVSPLE